MILTHLLFLYGATVFGYKNRDFKTLVMGGSGHAAASCPSCRQVPPLSQIPFRPGQIDFSKLTHISLSRRGEQRASIMDFVMEFTPQVNHHPSHSRPLKFLLDTWRSVSFVHAWDGSKGFVATNPRSDAGCFEYDPIGRICQYVGENMHAGLAVLPIPQLWLTNSRLPYVDGVIGANRLGVNFQRDFILFPDDNAKMHLVFNPPDLSSLICKGPLWKNAITADGFSKGTWQVNGHISVGGVAAYGEVVLTTGISPIELAPNVFNRFKRYMGSRLVYHEGFGAYRVRDCRHYREWFPRIHIDLGGFSTWLDPEDYTYFTSQVSGCLIDVQESKSGIMQLGPAFLRNVVTWFRETSVEFCERV
jgi:hypothetical protein